MPKFGMILRLEEMKGGRSKGMVDTILCPVGLGVAPANNTIKYWGYTSQCNLLDYPAVVFPVGEVDKIMDVPTKDFKAMTGVRVRVGYAD